MTTTQDTQNLDFQIFEGPNNREMPRLIAAGYVPASAAQIMRGRLEGRLAFDTHYGSGDAVVYHPNGSAKLVWDSQDLRKLNPESPLVDGALVLPAGAWESIDGKEFSKKEIARYTVERQSKDSVKGNPFWQLLARDDQSLLGEYADQVFSHVKQRYDRVMAMSVYASNPPGNAVVLRQWSLGGYVDLGYASGNLLVYDDGRLAGVIAPEARPRREKRA